MRNEESFLRYRQGCLNASYTVGMGKSVISYEDQKEGAL